MFSGFRVCFDPQSRAFKSRIVLSLWGRGGILHYSSILVHVRDRIKNVHFYSLLGLSAHKNVKGYPTVTKYYGTQGILYY